MNLAQAFFWNASVLQAQQYISEQGSLTKSDGLTQSLMYFNFICGPFLSHNY